MRKGVCFIALIAVLSVAGWSLSTATASGAEWKAGVAVIDITPEGPIWMAGYAARKGPSQGTAQRLHAKALALEDRASHRCVIVTTDLLGLPAAVSDPIAENVQRLYGLGRDQILFTSSIPTVVR